MNAGVVYASREEIQVHRFGPGASIGVPLLALFLQSYLPVAWRGRFHFVEIFDLPLLVTIFFAVARRNPAAGALTGCFIGLAQDALSAQFLGLFGIAKSIVGYACSSIASKIDVENPGSRIILTVVFYTLHQAIYIVIQRGLLREAASANWLHVVGAALANGILAVVVFSVLDRFKRRS